MLTSIWRQIDVSMIGATSDAKLASDWRQIGVRA